MNDPDTTAAPDSTVAVVIPCFRQAHFLGQAIESALGQSHAAREIVVIDDGSPDETGRVVDAYPGVRCIRQPNAGLAAARNRGLRETSSEFLVFLDADDRLLAEAVAAGSRALAADRGLAFTWGHNRPIDAGGDCIGDVSNPFEGVATYARLLERNFVGPPVGVMFRRAAVNAADGFSESLRSAEDYDLYLRLARQHAFHCHGRLIAEYRYHDANMSSDHARMLEAITRVLEQEAEWVGGDRELLAAIGEGIARARLRHQVVPAVDDLAHALRSAELRRAWKTFTRLARGSSRPFVREVLRRIRARASATRRRPETPG